MKVYSTGRRIGGVCFSGILGLVGGFGLGLYMSQTGSVDPSSKAALAYPIGGLILGAASSLFKTRKR